MLNLRFQRWMQAGIVCLLAVVMLGADPSSRFNRVGHQMMCACGCGQVLLECNHVGCPDSDRMIGELRAQIGGGGTDTSILNWFAAKYGATILAAPIRGGFDNVAWITPMAVFLLATVGAATFVWTFGHHEEPAVKAASQGHSMPAEHAPERSAEELMIPRTESEPHKPAQARAVAKLESKPLPVVAKKVEAKQESLQFEPVSRGRFEKSEPTIIDGQDLDVPTFLRKNVRIR